MGFYDKVSSAVFLIPDLNCKVKLLNFSASKQTKFSFQNSAFLWKVRFLKIALPVSCIASKFGQTLQFTHKSWLVWLASHSRPQSLFTHFFTFY